MPTSPMAEHESNNDKNQVCGCKESTESESPIKYRKFHLCLNYELPDDVEFSEMNQICKDHIEYIENGIRPDCKANLRYIPGAFCTCMMTQSLDQGDPSDKPGKFRCRRRHEQTKIVHAKFVADPTKSQKKSGLKRNSKHCRCLECLLKELYLKSYRFERSDCNDISSIEKFLYGLSSRLNCKCGARCAFCSKIKQNYEKKMAAFQAWEATCDKITGDNDEMVGRCDCEPQEPERRQNETDGLVQPLTSDCKTYLALAYTCPSTLDGTKPYQIEDLAIEKMMRHKTH